VEGTIAGATRQSLVRYSNGNKNNNNNEACAIIQLENRD
jgi:hypothetical protein